MSKARFKAYGVVNGEYKMLGAFARLSETRRAVSSNSQLDTWEVIDLKTMNVVESSEAVELAIYYDNGVLQPPTSVQIGGDMRAGSMVMVKFFPTLDKANAFICALEAEYGTTLLHGGPGV